MPSALSELKYQMTKCHVCSVKNTDVPMTSVGIRSSVRVPQDRLYTIILHIAFCTGRHCRYSLYVHILYLVNNLINFFLFRFVFRDSKPFQRPVLWFAKLLTADTNPFNGTTELGTPIVFMFYVLYFWFEVSFQLYLCYIFHSAQAYIYFFWFLFHIYLWCLSV